MLAGIALPFTEILMGNLNNKCSQRSNISNIKGYPHLKIIFWHNIAFTVRWMKFFIWRKNCISFVSYLHFWVFHESTNYKIYDIVKDITAY